MTLSAAQYMALFALAERQVVALERIAAAAEAKAWPVSKAQPERTDFPPGYGLGTRGG